ncbi:MAG: VCBS repeat-containing protein [Bacteroidetes bacterium]|nr:VCBS repeat-containing protein [Bacteroidota bacterium]
MKTLKTLGLTFILISIFNISFAGKSDYKRVKYNNPGLVVDLHVGLWAWPVPVDYDKDGDMDLLVSCPDVPYQGIYFFENIDGKDFPTFKPPVKLADKIKNLSASYVNGELRLLTPGKEVFMGVNGDFAESKEIYPTDRVETEYKNIRANQWKYVDYEGDGDLDLLIGHGIWDDYGWDNAFNEKGEWTNGPLHGFSYIVINKGNDEKPVYATPEKIRAGNAPADVFGMPSPCMEDFDGDGDLDLICGEFVDSFTWFENIGSRQKPKFAEGRKLTFKGEVIKIDLEMMVVISVDWDKDGDVDLVVGQEDGRIAFMENSGKVRNNMPVFKEPKFFKQEADDLIFGALVTPWSVDWDDDGDEDLICGNTAGYIGFIENLSGGVAPKWAEPVYLEADKKAIRIMADSNGSIQGPCEAKWGYTTLSVGDWDTDGLNDIVVNSITGTVIWYKNIGKKGKPKLAQAQNIEVAWKVAPPKPEWRWRNPEKTEMSAPWRTTPVIKDVDKDGVTDLVILDHEGYLAFFKGEMKDGRKIVLQGERIFKSKNGVVYDRAQKVIEGNSEALILNSSIAGSSGRRKICFADWNNDGTEDLILNSKPSIHWLQNVGKTTTEFIFTGNEPLGNLELAGHSTSPTKVDWNGDGIDDLLVGAEDGCFYYLENSRSKK